LRYRPFLTVSNAPEPKIEPANVTSVGINDSRSER
jgi:hypothetical protein